MEIQRVWVLQGPNVWSRSPVLEVELDLGGLKDSASREIPGFTDRLLTRLRTAGGREPLSGDGFVSQLRLGTHLAHVVQQLTLELQCLAGSDVRFGVHQAMREGLYLVVVEYEEEPLARACLEAAMALCLSAVHDGPYDLPAKLAELRDLAHEVRLGPSTAAIVRAARRRGIPVRRLNDGSLVQLGNGAQARRICTAETDRTSAIAEAVAQDKELTRALLRAVGVPVPDGRSAADADDAWEA